MKRLSVLLVAGVLIAGCGDNDASGPSNVFTFTSLLSPANEVPPVVGSPESSARGAVQITVTAPLTSAGALAGNGTADFYVQLTGFPGDTTFVGAHIHPGAAGVNGGVIINTTMNSTSGLTAQGSDTKIYEVRGISVTQAQLQGMIDNPAGFYFNVHSFRHPGGVVRGQLSAVR